jgi:hypothetical protein
MKRLFTAAILIVLAGQLVAQDVSIVERSQIPLADRVILSDLPEGNDPYFRNTEKAPEPGKHNGKAEWEALQRRLYDQKVKAMEDGSFFEPVGSVRSDAPQPVILQSFIAELSESHPNDDEGACAPNGFFINATNTGISIFNGSGSLIRQVGLVGFSSSISTRSNRKFDPRVVYDARNNRWIVVFLSGASPSRSQIVVCFSQTDNPLQGWNVYALEGNLRPNSTDVWADYPTIGISNSDLFVSLNLFDASNDFQTVGLYQVTLADGYAGNSLNSQSYIISGNAFTVVPIHDESDQPHDDFYLVSRGSRASLSGRNIVFYKVDGALANGGSLQGGVTLRARTSYSPAPAMNQKGSTTMLSPGDSRINNAFRKGNKFYFSFPSNVNNRSAIYWCSLDLAPLGINFSSLTTSVYASDSLEFAFPSVCWAGDSDGDDHSAFIFFNYSGVNHLPGTGVIYVTTDGQFSDPLLCSESDIPAPANRDTVENPFRRWGDYTDVSYMGNGTAWGVGYHYPSNRREATYATQFAVSQVSSVEDNTASAPEPVVISPNPVFDRAAFSFDVPQTGYYKAEILDLNGKVVQLVIEDRLIRGKAKLSFDTHRMAAGMYFVRVTGEGKELMRGKFVVE